MENIQISGLTATTTASGNYVAVDNSSNATYKLSTNQLLTIVATASSVSSLPVTISNTNITAKHVVINSVLSNPSAQTGDWTVTTSSGSAVVSGSISGTTNITLYLAESV